MKRFIINNIVFLLAVNLGFGQSLSFKTFMNPVIPGDHPDCSLSKRGNDFYTAGSSFNPTPVIYHSTDLVHWEAVAQPVSAAWSGYGNAPAGGCWGGQVVYHGDKYWYFFSHGNQMYFTTADDIKGAWTMPTLIICPSEVPGLGYDNSIFIDDNDSWYLLVKNGQENNWIVQLGDDGQAHGAIYDLTWINPAPDYPYSYAEGPVMWKFNGHYYYSFARNVGGGQKVFRSDSLTDNENSWVNLGNFFDESDPFKYDALFQNPNHSSAVVMINDSTSWVIHPLWRNANDNEWYGQGRQGLLNQVRYNAEDKPTVDYPVNEPKDAPVLPSSGIPWMVAHSDFFYSEKLNPEWSFSGQTPNSTWSLSKRNGWLTLSPRNRNYNTVIKTDAEHNYSLITKVDFTPVSKNDQAGLWIFNGNQTLYAKLYSSIDSSGNKIVAFSYGAKYYEAANPAENNTVLLKLIRINHKLTGYFSLNGFDWTRVGEEINVAGMDGLQDNYNSWTGNRQGLFVKAISASAAFDYYIYRDAYTPIMAECPANQYGTAPLVNRYPPNDLTDIDNNHWALYAGVEFGNEEYPKSCDSLKIVASCDNTGGDVEVYIDSIDVSTKIATCSINNTGSWTDYKTFRAVLLQPVSGNHDVYLKFTGEGSDDLFQLQTIQFVTNSTPTSVENSQGNTYPRKFHLDQNYPNPFNPMTMISYQLPVNSNVELDVFDVTGRIVKTLVKTNQPAGSYKVPFDASGLASGVYFYKMQAESFVMTKKLVLLR